MLNAEVERRDFLISMAVAAPILLEQSDCRAKEVLPTDDMTSTFFNPDGSLKEGVDSEARFQKIDIVWDPSTAAENRYLINVDGIDVTNNDSTSVSSTNGRVKISYELPLKWKGPSRSGESSQENLYLDWTVKQDAEGAVVKALSSIIVYQAPGVVKMEQLEKASSTGISKALNVLPALSALENADFVGGRVRTVAGNPKIFDFDLAVAPKTCPDDSEDNLRLGFCPFDAIYLLSGTVFNDKLYVFALKCDKDQWKRYNADLRRVRSSFTIASFD